MSLKPLKIRPRNLNALDAALKRMPVAEGLFARILEPLNIQLHQLQDYTKLPAKSIDQVPPLLYNNDLDRQCQINILISNGYIDRKGKDQWLPGSGIL
jgi:hypothetical protein